MSTVTLTPLFTDAGLAAVSNATGNGLQAVISEIAIGDAGYAPGASATSLQNELVRVNCSAGGAVSPNEVLVEAAVAAGSPTFFIREIGFFLDDGTLLAIWSDENQTVGYRSDLAPWFFKFVLAWESLPADAITVNFNGDAQQAALALDVAQTEGKVRHAVEVGGGMEWNDGDNTQLTAAISSMIAGSVDNEDFSAALAAYLDANGYMQKSVSAQLTAGFSTDPLSLVPADGVVKPNLSDRGFFVVETVTDGGLVTDAFTLAYPDELPGAGVWIIKATQDETGGHGLALSSSYKIQRGNWSTEANAVNLLYLTCDGSSIYVTISQGEA